MFYSTVYPELKAIVFNKTKSKSTKKKKKKPGKENKSLGEASEATTECGWF